MRDAIYRYSSVEWKPSRVVALATSIDGSQVAAVREDGSLEIWLVSPGSVSWHCQLKIHGDPKSRVSSLVWCRAGSIGLPSGRLFSSSFDGSVLEWDLFHLTQKTVLPSIGVTIWKMAVTPTTHAMIDNEHKLQNCENGYLKDERSNSDDSESSDSDDDLLVDEHREHSAVEDSCLALACDDGCVRIYAVSDKVELIYRKTLPRVSGRCLSVAWRCDAKMIFSGSSDGFIRCWNAKLAHEMYRITVGHGGFGSGPDLCVWSLLVLRDGTLVSGDSNGSVQFWDSLHGTLLQAHSSHKGDVNSLATAPSHNRVFSAGSDGQVVLYKLSSESIVFGNENSSETLKKWIYVGYVRAHTHDIRALAVAVPISREDPLPDEKQKKPRTKEKPVTFSYHRWAHLGVPMLISTGDDTKLFAYPVQEFTKFSPHDICPAPQSASIQLVCNSNLCGSSLLLVQASHWLDVRRVCLKGENMCHGDDGLSIGRASTELIVQIKAKASRKILCSSISNSGVIFAYSDHIRPHLFELENADVGRNSWNVRKKGLPHTLPFAHSMIFSSDSSRLIVAGHDRKIYVVDVCSLELVHKFIPRQESYDNNLPPNEPPITKMFTSSDGRWLAAANCFGDVYIFNLDTLRQHWFVSRLDGASVTSGGFPPQDNNILVVTTSSNQVYAFDIEAKHLGEWSRKCTFSLPARFQEFPGEVVGLSFLPQSSSPSAIVYSARARCTINFGLPVDRSEENDIVNGHFPAFMKLKGTPINGKLKRKLIDRQKEVEHRKNYEFFGFRDPVLFIGHLSKHELLIIDKRWMDVVKTLDSAPVHRHIFGT